MMVLDATYISAKKTRSIHETIQGASMKPSKHKMTVLSQIFKLIPRNLIPKLANEFGIDRQSRVFSPTSHGTTAVFFFRRAAAESAIRARSSYG